MNKRGLAIRIAMRLALWVIHMIMATCRVHIHGLQHFIATAAKGKCILMLWHNRLALIPYLGTYYAKEFTYTAVVSASRDGELLDAVVRCYPNARTIRVGKDARFQAVRDIVAHLQSNHVILMTPDGPRGPRYRIKPGIALAAKTADAHVVPLSWEASRYWEFNTWDRLRIPKPFSRVDFTFSKALHFDQHLSRDEVTSLLQQAMNSD